MLHATIHSERYYFDITDVLEFARFNATLSGIQRVSLRIIGHLVDKYSSDRIRLIAFHPILRKVVEIDSSFLTGSYSFEQQSFCNHLALHDNFSFKSYLREKYPRRYKRRFHRFRLSILNRVTNGRTFARRGLNIGGSSKHLKPIGLAKDDTVIVLGATWNFDSYLEFLKKEKHETGVRIALFIHDLIPLVAPEHVVDHVPEQFDRWLRFASSFTDKYLVNSENTKKDLEWYLSKVGKQQKNISVVPLAHEFIADQSEALRTHYTDTMLRNKEQYRNSLRVRAHVLNAARLPYVLCVGTFESRKNIWTLVNVWKTLLERVGPNLPRLVLAGKHGWLKEDVDDFLKGTGNLNGYIRFCERPYDFELEFLYRNCLFTVFPSYYEGWGLPIGESLWFKKFVVASSSSSMPEVGGEMADYADPNCFSSIYQAIEKPILDRDYLNSRTQAIKLKYLRTWEIVSEDLWRAIKFGNIQPKDITEYPYNNLDCASKTFG